MSDQFLNYHPLQRLPAPSRGASALLHGLSLASFSYSFYYLHITPNPVNDSYGWHFQYLTIVGLALSFIAFTFGLVSDALLSPTIFKIKNVLAIAAAPLEVLISMLYWGLRAIDPKLVVLEFAPPIPFQVDASLHIVPAVVLLTDILFFSPPWTIGAVPAIGLSSGIAVAYWFWVEACYAQNGFYPYPIFDEAGFEGRVGLFSMSAVVMAAAGYCLKQVYGYVNGWEVPGRVAAKRAGPKTPAKGTRGKRAKKE